MKFKILFHTTALIAAVKGGNENIVQYLLSHSNIDVNMCSIFL